MPPTTQIKVAHYVDGGYDFYGEFWVSNAVVGVMYLDGELRVVTITATWNSSYVMNPFFEENQGFANAYGTSYNTVFKGSNNGSSIATTGTGLVFLHTSSDEYDLRDGLTRPNATWPMIIIPYTIHLPSSSKV